MRIYDVVQIVTPGAITSDRPGRWLVAFREDEREALRVADRCNEACSLVDGIGYRVECHDEESTQRARYMWEGRSE